MEGVGIPSKIATPETPGLKPSGASNRSWFYDEQPSAHPGCRAWHQRLPKQTLVQSLITWRERPVRQVQRLQVQRLRVQRPQTGCATALNMPCVNTIPGLNDH